MGNENIPKELEFLMEEDASMLFNELYDKLRGGVHIHRQNYDKLFNFIEKKRESIESFFLKFSTIQLCSEGQQSEKYYFCDFLEGSRGNTKKREYMENHILIVGFLLYKAVFLDSNLEITSVKDFQKIIIHDYKEYQTGIIKNLAKARREQANSSDDEIIKQTIKSAFREFDKIGWLKLYTDEDKFDLYPAFNRIVHKYYDKINTIDAWLPKNNEKISSNS